MGYCFAKQAPGDHHRPAMIIKVNEHSSTTLILLSGNSPPSV